MSLLYLFALYLSIKSISKLKLCIVNTITTRNTSVYTFYICISLFCYLSFQTLLCIYVNAYVIAISSGIVITIKYYCGKCFSFPLHVHTD